MRTRRGRKARIGTVVSSDRRVLLRRSRKVRSLGIPVLFGWPAGRDGFCLMWTGPGCPCVECFETQNPKAFSKGTPASRRRLAAEARRAAAGSRGRVSRGRLLLWTRKGIAVHEVVPSAKCPARLSDEGFRITP